MTAPLPPFREPARTTLARTIGIAVIVGAVLAWRFRRPQFWPIAATLALWFSLGGHWLEVWYLNWLRPRLSASRGAHVAVRVLVWFLGGVVLGAGVVLTMNLFPMPRGVSPPKWWIAGVAFIVVELVVHVGLSARRRPSFYSGRG